jgi:hypothetical protein
MIFMSQGHRRKFDPPLVGNFGDEHFQNARVSFDAMIMIEDHERATKTFHVDSVTNIEFSQKRCRSFEPERGVGPGDIFPRKDVGPVYGIIATLLSPT